MPSESSWYEVKNVTKLSSGEIAATIAAPADSPWFCGHFPGDPILPAIAQLSIVFDVLRLYKNVNLISMKRVRFRKIIRPGEQISVSLSVSKEKPLSCSFKLTSQEEIASSGIFMIEEKKEDDNGE